MASLNDLITNALRVYLGNNDLHISNNYNQDLWTATSFYVSPVRGGLNELVQAAANKYLDDNSEPTRIALNDALYDAITKYLELNSITNVGQSLNDRIFSAVKHYIDNVATGPTPINLTLPSIAGDLYEGGQVTFTPGLWSDAVSWRYRVLKGTVTEPDDPVEVLLDWTASTTGTIPGISDGDYLWLEEEATGPGGQTAVAASIAGHGPMESLSAADAAVIAVGGYNSPTSVATTEIYTFNITIPAASRKGFLLCLHCQGTAVSPYPTWSSVSINGTPMTLIKSIQQTTVLDATRGAYTEIWGLWGNDVPSGSNMVVTATKSPHGTMRSTLVGIAIENTQTTMPVDGDIASFGEDDNLTSYSFASSTSANKKLVIAFPFGQFFSGITGDLTVTPGSGWTEHFTDSWPNARNGSSLTWTTVMTNPRATSGAFNIDYTAVDGSTTVQRYGGAITVTIAGDNS